MVESLKPIEEPEHLPDKTSPLSVLASSEPAPAEKTEVSPVAVESVPVPPSAEQVLNYASLATVTTQEATVAQPLASPDAAQAPTVELPAVPLAELAAATPEPAPAPEPQAPVVVLPPCPCCAAPRTVVVDYCNSCGYFFPPEAAAPPPLAQVVEPTPGPPVRLRQRYEVGTRLHEHYGVERFRGLDHGQGESPVPVILVRSPGPPAAEVLPAAQAEPPPPLESRPTEEISVTFGTPFVEPVTDPVGPYVGWPSLPWEAGILAAAHHPFLPTLLDAFSEGGYDYLVEEVPVGRSLWDAWDDPDATQEQRFTWLKHVAEQLKALHGAGALLESLRPDGIVVTADGRGRLADLGELLPLPLPADVPIRGTLYTAPELLAFHPRADARANLYSFGATLYSLHVGRELTEMDFDRPGQPKPFIPRFPDIHPLFGRLVMKTFCREPAGRFPSDEAAREDPSGFTELIRVLEVCARTLDTVRLEIAAWTTTGMIRTGNEDAFALLHACESRQDDVGDCTLVLLADGMGGYEAGEVAAALAIQTLRRLLLQHKPFAPLGGATAFASDLPRPEGNPTVPLDVEQARKLIYTALKETNRHVFQSSRTGVGRRGMGCTAEVVYVDGRHVVVGHVGDSRTYHLQEGRLVQLTRDQTLVNRLVELGTLTPEEAETHPRRNELQQAIGGQPEVEPGISHAVLKPGDWVLVCSDGVTNHVKDRELKQMLQSEAISAEMAARRLVNLVNIEGATDNATVVVIRAT